MACDRPPIGWCCSRPAGHEGPCAARPFERPALWFPDEALPSMHRSPAPNGFAWFLFVVAIAFLALGFGASWAFGADRPVLKTSGFEFPRNLLKSTLHVRPSCAVPGRGPRQRLIAPPPAVRCAFAHGARARNNAGIDIDGEL